jgi:hypothetical protein
VFTGLLALWYYAGPARYSADYYLEKKVTWWVAEFRRSDVLAVTLAGGAAPSPAATVPARRAAEPTHPIDA